MIDLKPYYQVKLTLLRWKTYFLYNPTKTEDEKYASDIIQKAYSINERKIELPDYKKKISLLKNYYKKFNNTKKKGTENLKKVIILLINLLLLVCLSSCANVEKEVELSQDRTNVESIEIYNSERAYYEGDIHGFLEENEPIGVLKSEKISDFLDTLCALKFEEENVFFPIPVDGGYDYNGYMIAIEYSDGGYDIFAEGGLYSYAVDNNGQGRHKYDHSDYCGEVAWNDFVKEFIEQ